LDTIKPKEKSPSAYLKERILLLQNLRSDETGLKLAGLKKYYTTHPADFINDWAITYDPRVPKTPYLPFTLFPKQREMIDWLWDRYVNKEDGIVEKTRDFGASYVCMAFAVHSLIFIPGSKIGVGSRKEKLVDEVGNPDSLFEKCRIILDHLPYEFRPNKLQISHMKIINSINGSTITGEAGDNIGRGGRNSIYFIDEAAFIERSQKVDSALSMNSDVKISVSTPNGAGNPFFVKRFSNKYPVFICDWREDPRKDQDWYDKQCDILEPWIVAQEIDRDYYASIEGLAIPAKYVKAAIDFPLKAEGEKIAGFDVADDSGEKGDANALCLRHGPVVKSIETWKYKTTTESARKAYSICKEKGYGKLQYETNGVGAGVKGEVRSIQEHDENKHELRVVGINPGSTKLPGVWAEGKLDQDMFANLRAKLWWSLRRRFKRTYQRKMGIQDWADEYCISIPNDNQLILELSQPKIGQNEAGKLLMEAKAKMKTRGVKSGNKADSLILSEYKGGIVYAA